MLIYVVVKFYVITFLFHLTWENSLFCKVLQFDENLCLADSSYMPPLLLVEYFVRRVHPWTCPHCLVTRLTLFCCYVFLFFFFRRSSQFTMPLVKKNFCPNSSRFYPWKIGKAKINSTCIALSYSRSEKRFLFLVMC